MLGGFREPFFGEQGSGRGALPNALHLRECPGLHDFPCIHISDAVALQIAQDVDQGEAHFWHSVGFDGDGECGPAFFFVMSDEKFVDL
jgi:hypothetical protein